MLFIIWEFSPWSAGSVAKTVIRYITTVQMDDTAKIITALLSKIHRQTKRQKNRIHHQRVAYE